MDQPICTVETPLATMQPWSTSLKNILPLPGQSMETMARLMNLRRQRKQWKGFLKLFLKNSTLNSKKDGTTCHLTFYFKIRY